MKKQIHIWTITGFKITGNTDILCQDLEVYKVE